MVSLTVGGAGAGRTQPAQKVTGPVATYWMSAQTQTGFGMPAGGRPSASAMMNAMMGRGSGAQHSLLLQLGSSRAADGEPEAEHLPPPGLQAGPSLPLLTPRSAAPAADRPQDIPRELARPKGRMLVFWGCGEHARAGQPLVLDFAELSSGKAPAAFQALSRGIGVTPMQPPAPGRDRTYGEWPNERTRTTPPPAGSLVGEHVVRGDYTPEIRFSLTPAQDFLGPLNLTTNAPTPAGAVQLGWGGVSGAQAYLATAVGGGQADTMVMWTSSEVQAAAFAMPDYIGTADLARLVQSRVLMSPQTTACTVPKEVVDAAPSAMVQLVAYGGEANFVHPPRPSDPKVAWNKEWQVKVRYRSATGGMLGASPGAMSQAGDGDHGASPPSPQTPPPRGARTRSVLRGLGDALGVPIPTPRP